MEKEILFRDSRVYYRVMGNGPVVMLVHGFGEDRTIWRQLQDDLAQSFQLIIPDLPGSGHSSMTEDMSMESLAAVLKAVASKETGDNRFSMIGHSMGGYIALAFAEKYPDLLNALGLFHSTAFADSEEKKQVRQKGIDFIRQHGAFAFLEASTPNLFSPKTRDQRPGLIDEQLGRLHNFSAAALVSYYEAMMKRPDRTSILKKTDMPVLFIMGEYDTAVPLADGLKQCHLPGISYIHVLKESGHMGMLEEAGTSSRHLNEFLKRAT